MEIDSLKCFYKKPRNIKHHFVGSIKDEDKTIIIIKYYGIHKQWWHYEVWEKYHLQMYFDSGLFYEK